MRVKGPSAGYDPNRIAFQSEFGGLGTILGVEKYDQPSLADTPILTSPVQSVEHRDRPREHERHLPAI